MEKALKQDEIDALFAGAQKRVPEPDIEGQVKSQLKGQLQEQWRSQPKVVP